MDLGIYNFWGFNILYYFCKIVKMTSYFKFIYRLIFAKNLPELLDPIRTNGPSQ
jgi:hypothetical protein